MTAYQKKYIRTALTGLPILLAYICRMINIPREIPFTSLTVLRSVLYIFTFSAWTVSVYSRIVQKKAKAYLSSAAGLMIFWIAIRTVKFLIPEEHYLVHWCWYLFYLPLIYIPLFTLFVSRYICQKEDFIIPKWQRMLFIPAAILLLFVLTNDLHHLVFVFPPYGPKYPLNGYSHGFVYYGIVYWIAFCFTGVVASVFIKNRMTDKKYRILIPVTVLGLLAIYAILYIQNISFIMFWFGDFTIVFCLFFLVFYESLFRLNLIQSNTRYSELFRCSSMSAVIVDKNYNTLVNTASYINNSENVMRAAETKPIIMHERIRLSSAPIKNGHVLWEEDISGLLTLNKQLSVIRLNIEEQNTAELEAYKTEYQRRQLVERNRLYDKMQEKTQTKVQQLSDLIEKLDKTSEPSEEKQLLLKISVIGAYIKRRNNLSFLSEDWKQFPPGELKNCIEQSMEALTLFGIEAEQEFRLKNDMFIENTIRLYEVFEEAVEYSLDTLSELALTFSESENGTIMSLRLCSEADFSSFISDDIIVQNEGDGEWLISYRVKNGGADE